MNSPKATENQDYRQMCKQTERDTEAKKLANLIERIKRQLAEQAKNGGRVA